jgi:hypothetical protein
LCNLIIFFFSFLNLIKTIVNTTMLREYVTFIGLMSHTRNGIGLLIDSGIFDSLNDIIDKDYDHVLNLVIFSLDYSKE